jgi:DNA polymerase I-like protein with 3'-5' exonuclease and polymerase domains
MSASRSSAPDFRALAQNALDQWRSDQPIRVGLDTETEGVAYYDRAFCVTASWWSGDQIVDHYIELVEEDFTEFAREIISGTPVWVFHNAKFDLQKLLLAGVIRRHEITTTRFEDTEALAHLDNSLRLKGLKFLSAELLGDTKEEEEALKVAMRKHKLKLEDGYHLLPREVLIPYAVKDTNKTVRLWDNLAPKVKQHPELWELYLHEKEVTLALLDIEARGLRIDVDYVTKTLGELSGDFMQAEQRISELVGKPVGKDTKAGEFNPGSAPQLAEYFQEKGYESNFKTKKGAPSYGKEFLAGCDDPLGPLLTEYRRVAKLKNTYFLAMRDEHRDGILHPHFRQHGTRTGRFSSGEAQDD